MGYAHQSGRALGTAFALNLVFAGVELVGGLWSNSMAVISDAVHDAGDSLSLGVAWLLQHLSGRTATTQFTYGFRRLNVAGALFSGLVLIAGLAMILWETVPRLRDPQPVNAPVMMGLALLGVSVNGFAAWRVRRGTSLNEQLVGWHLVEDALGWGAVLIGALAIHFYSLLILDPLLSAGIAVFILIHAVGSLKRVALVFLQTAPEGFDVERFHAQVCSQPGIVDAHHTHSWSVDGERHVLSTHLVLPDDASPEDYLEAKSRVRALLRGHHFEHVTLEVERAGEKCPGEGCG